MNIKKTNSLNNDMYSHDYLVRVPYVFPHRPYSSKATRYPIWASLLVSGISMTAIVIYRLNANRVMVLDLDDWILMLITGVVSFALARIIGTIFFGD